MTFWSCPQLSVRRLIFASKKLLRHGPTATPTFWRNVW
jgi:hypothetical protein